MFERFRETGVLTEAIREALCSYRKAHGLSRYALGRKLDAKAITIERWERGVTRGVQMSHRGMIADLLEGKLDGGFVKCSQIVDTSQNPELIRILYNVFDIYTRCKTPESRKQLFLKLDELATKIRNALNYSNSGSN